MVFFFMSRGTAFPTRLYVRTAHPRRLIRVLAVCLRTLWIIDYLQSVRRILRSNCADAQSDLSFRWSHMQSCRKYCVPANIYEIIFEEK